MNTMRRVIPSIFGLALLVQAQGEGADLRAPRLGYASDPSTKSLRPIEGIPGAAFLGPAMDLGGQFSHVAVCRNLGYILAISSQDHVASVLQVGSGTVVPRAIAGAGSPIDRVILILGHRGTALRQECQNLPDRHRIACHSRRNA